MRHELKFKPALVTWILLLAIYWPLAFIMALLGFGMAWDGSKNWLMNAFNKIFHLTPYCMVLNWLIFSIFGGGLVLVIMRIVIVYILLICFSSCDENFEKSDLIFLFIINLNVNDLLPNMTNNEWNWDVPTQNLTLEESNLLSSAVKKIGNNT